MCVSVSVSSELISVCVIKHTSINHIIKQCLPAGEEPEGVCEETASCV